MSKALKAIIALVLVGFAHSVFAAAGEVTKVLEPVSSAVATIAAATSSPVGDPISPSDFFSQVIEVVKSIGGVSLLLKISLIITLLVSSMKVTFLDSLVWSKLGPAKTWVAPVLALIAGVLGLGAGGQPFSWALVFAYVTAGGGAVFLHEILDSLKSVPGIGPIMLKVIALIEAALKPKVTPPTT